MQDRQVVPGGLLKACGDPPELLEPAEAALHQMALGVEVLVERVLAGARRVVGDDGERALVGDGRAQVVGVIPMFVVRPEAKGFTSRWT